MTIAEATVKRLLELHLRDYAIHGERYRQRDHDEHRHRNDQKAVRRFRYQRARIFRQPAV